MKIEIDIDADMKEVVQNSVIAGSDRGQIAESIEKRIALAIDGIETKDVSAAISKDNVITDSGSTTDTTTE